MENKKRKGDIGEHIATDYLTHKKYIILENNYRIPSGEIDIIAKDGEYIVFVEVKLRYNLNNGYPREAVHRPKQKSIIRVAQYYIQEKQLFHHDFRFDVIEILGDKVEHIENAFWA